jgi:NADH dehydrogenase [ubiquinone] 1 alpha subcomplex assembly factor 7
VAQIRVSDTPLGVELRRLMAANGPMSIAEFMAHCLSDPKHGYYATRDPFGAAGDFITAPEVSQMFGEMVGAWLVEAWRLSGAPDPVNFVELGPGRGTLMSDILRVGKNVPNFHRAISLNLVEISPTLREAQRKALGALRTTTVWRDAVHDVPTGPLLLVANEFFDALPIRQFVRTREGWHEHVVGLDRDSRFVFGIGSARLDGAPEAPEGAMLELRPAADAIVAEAARRIVDHGGAALLVDYGHAETAFGDTLQAMRGHVYADPLEAPGETDLTAHVDFAALGRAARAQGAAAHGPMPQGEFLTALGIRQRAERLAASADEAGRESVRAALDRLTAPDQMGTLFKVMAITRPGLFPPPFAAAV